MVGGCIIRSVLRYEEQHWLFLITWKRGTKFEINQAEIELEKFNRSRIDNLERSPPTNPVDKIFLRRPRSGSTRERVISR